MRCNSREFDRRLKLMDFVKVATTKGYPMNGVLFFGSLSEPKITVSIHDYRIA